MMEIRHLLILCAVLALAVVLAWTNPSMDMYLAFVEAELNLALDRHESSPMTADRKMLRTIFRAHSHELVSSIVRPHTVQRNWGLFSFFETAALDAHIEVLGVGGHFIPLKGIDEAVLRLGRLAL